MPEDRHPPCLCGCNQLADECAGPVKASLGSIQVGWRDRDLVNIVFGRRAE